MRDRGDRLPRTGAPATTSSWDAEHGLRPESAVIAGRIRRLQEVAAALLATRLPEVGPEAGLGALGRLTLLDAVSAHLAESADEVGLVAGVARLAVPALGDWAAVFVEAGGAPVLAAASGDPSLGSLVSAHVLADPAARLASACRCEDVAELRLPPPSPGAGRPPASVAALCVARRPLGALVVARTPRSPHPPADRALLGEVAHRTALALDQARRLRDATRAAREREDLLHAASHELRGPLGTLRLTADLLARELHQGDRASAVAQLESILRQAERLARLSDALLDASRITAGRLALALAEDDLAALARRAVDRLAEGAAGTLPAIALDAPAPVRCTLDAARVEQVLSNLLSNAVKYGEGRPIRVAVWAEGGRAFVAVEDRGIGIAPEDLGRIFERFERAAPGRRYGGDGLGLWIVRRIVEAHGGAVEARSVVGGGATFTVGLPIAPCPGAAGGPPARGPRAPCGLDP